MEIIPGILEKEWSEIKRKIEIVKTFSKTASQSNVAEANTVSAIHIDIIDGKFAPNTTFLDPFPFVKYSKEIIFEAHLMVDEPIQYLKPFANAGFKRFLGHIEKMSDQAEFVAQGELLGQVGLAIDVTTNLSEVKVPYEDLDAILIMTVKAGESGQIFNSEYLKKVEVLSTENNPSTLRRLTDRSGLVIEVDGGINDKTIIEAKNAGATRFIANSFIFNPLQDVGPQKQFNLLEKCLE